MQNMKSGPGDKGTTGQTGDMMDQAREGISQVTDRAMSEAEPRIDEGRMKVAEGLQSMAQAFRSSGQQLRDEQHPQIAQFTNRAADEVERFSSYLQQKDIRSMMSEVQEVAKREPALFVGAAFAVGLLGARFLKSAQPSQEMRSMQPQSSRSYGASYSPYAPTGSSLSSTEPQSDLGDPDAMLASSRPAAEEIR